MKKNQQTMMALMSIAPTSSSESDDGEMKPHHHYHTTGDADGGSSYYPSSVSPSSSSSSETYLSSWYWYTRSVFQQGVVNMKRDRRDDDDKASDHSDDDDDGDGAIITTSSSSSTITVGNTEQDRNNNNNTGNNTSHTASNKPQWKWYHIIIFGQILSFLLATTGATQTVLEVNCQVMAPAFAVGVFYLGLSLINLVPLMIGNIYRDNKSRICKKNNKRKHKDSLTMGYVDTEEGCCGTTTTPQHKKEGASSIEMTAKTQQQQYDDTDDAASDTDDNDDGLGKILSACSSSSCSSTASTTTSHSSTLSGSNTMCSSLLHHNHNHESKKKKTAAAAAADQYEYETATMSTPSAPAPQYTFLFGLIPLHAPFYLYAPMAVLDFYANYLTVQAYSRTTLTSVTLFDALSIPTAMFLSYVALKRRFISWHYLGVAVCLLGIVLNVMQDYHDDITNGGDTASSTDSTIDLYPHKLRGDLLAIMAGIFFGSSGVAQEYAVKELGGPSEFLGMMGFFAASISLVHVVLFERQKVADLLFVHDHSIDDDTDSICQQSTALALLVAYVASNMTMYMGSARFLQISEATFYNLSLLTGDLWSVTFSVFGEHIMPGSAFFVALACIVTGVILYESAPTKPTTTATALPSDGVVKDHQHGVRRCLSRADDEEAATAGHELTLTSSTSYRLSNEDQQQHQDTPTKHRPNHALQDTKQNTPGILT